MSHTPVRILLVEDDAVDRLACRRALGTESDYAFEILETDSALDGLERVHADTPDLILLDYHLPDMDGGEFLAELAAETGEVAVPVVMLTGAQDIAIAVDAMRRGARDYLIKDGERDYLKLLPMVIKHVLQEEGTRREKRRAESKYRSLVEQIPAITYIAALDAPNKLVYVSPQTMLLGFQPEIWLADPDLRLRHIHDEDRASVQ